MPDGDAFVATRLEEAPAPGCCSASGPALAFALDDASAFAGDRASERWARDLGDGLKRVELMTPDVHCGACIATIESGLGAIAGVERVRANLTLRRVAVEYRDDEFSVDATVRALDGLGFPAKPFDAEALDAFRKDKTGRELLASLAVAGFAAANVMLLSVAVWSGAEGVTRDFLHWVSALIALPAVAFAGRPFFRSAATALSAGRLNMDVPISLAVLLAAGVSLFETMSGGDHAFFDASVSLLFFLLIGRYLDHRTRGLARSAAAELAALSASSATRIDPDGRRHEVPIDAIEVGDRVAVAVGERAPVDGVVEHGASDVDCSMVTGETAPERVNVGDRVYAGMMNLTGPLRLKVEATEEGTLLSEIARMIEAAERGANRYTRLADRAAKVYAPGVHILAALVFIGWMIVGDGDWRAAIMAASALLIITCPCALGLAVPATQATAGGVLFRAGVLVKDGAALEKLAQIDMAVFDKTGTATLGRPVLVDGPPTDHAAWPIARAMAEASRHPLSRALAAAAAERGASTAVLSEAHEVGGAGVDATLDDGRRARLGRADWCGIATADDDATSVVWLAIDGDAPVAFRFEDALRHDAAAVIAAFKAAGVETALLSGDREGPVAAAAEKTGVDHWLAAQSPAEKLAFLDARAAEGRKVLMVGDGLNDAPALAAAYASISPSEASDISRTAAGLVFSGEALSPVLLAYRVAVAARRRALENFGLAAVYNAIAIPLAAVGLVTPLVAALAMSGSSILVTLNALRLRWLTPANRKDAT